MVRTPGMSKRAPRVDVRKPAIVVNSDGMEVDVIILDVSGSGFRLHVIEKLNIGEFVSLRIDDELLQRVAVQRRKQEVTHADEELDRFGVGLARGRRDVAVFFDRKRRTFTHRIDPRIDDERDKIMSDLAFTQMKP